MLIFDRIIIIMTKTLLLLLLLVLRIESTDQCFDIVSNWIDNPQTLSPIVYGNSGKFLNDLGDYNNCQYHKQEYVYFTMQVINRLAASLQFMGLCAPISCEQEIASNVYAPIIQEKLNTAYQSAANTTFVAFVNLKFFNPVEAQPKMDWSNYLVIGLIATLILIGIIGSIISKITQSQSKPVKVLQAFSIYDNLAKIFTIPKEVENQNLLFLNGARTLSILWIIFGHDTWFHWMNLKNWTEALDLLTTPGLSTLIPATYFAVDTFFWIGGFLITLGMLQQFKKVTNFLKFYIGAIVHRFIRIWPTYMLAILIFWKIAPYISSGPIWSIYYKLSCTCNDGGVLWNMFFIDNFGDHGPAGMDYCFAWGWYLAVDFQLFLITPFILYAYHKNKKLGWIVALALFIISVVIAFIQIIVNNWRYPIPNPKLPAQPQFMDKFYYKPWIRASAYMMGIFSGFIYVEWKNGDATIVKYVNKVKQSILIRCLFYIVGIALCEMVIWIVVPFQEGEEWSTLTQAFYNSLNRVFFLIGVYLCIFAAMFGCKNDPSRIILGHWIFSPLAKISFCTYLIHFIVIFKGLYQSRMDLYWQTSTIITVVISDIFWSLVSAIGLSCLIQAPILGLQKIFLRPAKSKGEKVKSIIQNKDSNLSAPLIQNHDISIQQIPQKIPPHKDDNNLLL